MKFWELISAFRDSPEALTSVLTSEQWRIPYAVRYSGFDEAVDTQNRIFLDSPVPVELSREVAARSPLLFVFDRVNRILRRRGALPDGVSDSSFAMTALEVHDQFGGAIIEEVLEYGSARV